MRLIDGDALKQHFTDMQHYERCACNFTDDGGEPATEWYCVEDALENAHTIDAIPVEWMVSWINRHPNDLRCAWFVSLEMEWRKEQEAR